MVGGVQGAPLTITPKTEIKVAMEFDLYCLLANFSDPILKLDCLDPMNMKITSIWQFKSLDKYALFHDVSLSTDGGHVMASRWWVSDSHLHPS